MRIGIDTNSFSFRDAEIVVFDYALHNQFLLKNEFLIFHQSNLPSASIVEGDLRNELNFPNDTTVLASYGGQERFHLLPYV